MLKVSDAVDSLLENLLEDLDPNLSKSVTSTEKYQLPIRVGQHNKLLDEGDKPWIVGHFAPGTYLNDTHPQGHEGVDLKAAPGTLIYSIASGIVVDTSQNMKGGITCKVAHENGQVVSYYAHMSKLLVQLHQEVSQQTPLGVIGQTGNAKGRGEHLHYEVKVIGQKIDPLSVKDKIVGTLSQEKHAEWENLFDGITKEAGLFKVPEQILNEIKKYALSVFAREQLKEIDKKIQVLKYPDKLEKLKQLKSTLSNFGFMEGYLEGEIKLTGEIGIGNYPNTLFYISWNMSPNFKLNYDNLWDSYDDDANFTYNIELLINSKFGINFYYKQDEVKYSKWSKHFYKFLEELEKFLQNFEYYYRYNDLDDIEYLFSMKRYLEQFVSSHSDNIFKIDEESVIEVLFMKKPSQDAVGYYNGRSYRFINDKIYDVYQIEIYFPIPPDFIPENINSLKIEVENISQTVRHEVQHVFQEFYQRQKELPKLTGLSGKKERSKIFDANGLTPDLRQKYVDEKQDKEELKKERQPHALRDVEYQTRLSDSVEKFKYCNKDVPEDRKIENAKMWINGNNYFFKQLKQNFPKRWKKAIREFWKAIFNDEITLKDLGKDAWYNISMQKIGSMIQVPQSLFDEIYDFAKNAYLNFVQYQLNKGLLNLNAANEEKIILYLKQNLTKIFTSKSSDYWSQGFIFKYKRGEELETHYISVYIKHGDHLAATYEYKPVEEKHEIEIFFNPNSFEKINNTKMIKTELLDLKNSIRHELQHFMQRILKMENLSYWEAGFSEKRSLEKYNPYKEVLNWKERYLLRDIEFYTHLSDAISLFKDNYGNLPPDEKLLAAKYYIGEKVASEERKKIQKNLEINTFFYTLKNKNIFKWRKAVKEFYKALNINSNKLFFNKSAGLIKVPRNLLNEISEFVISQYSLIISQSSDILLHYEQLSKREINNLQEIRQACQNLIKSNIEVSNKVFNFDGNQITVIMGQLKNKDGARAFLTKKDSMHYLIIRFRSDLDNIEDFNKEIFSLKESVEHELQHFMQNIYANFGLPPKKIRDNLDIIQTLDNQNEEEYYQDNYEFYPTLQTTIKVFNYLYKNSTPEEKIAAAKIWIGEPAIAEQTANLFKYLYKNSPKKYQKAVKEFWKSIF